ncbi:copper chaperone PCu(A)C [Nocardia sp. NPDC004340]
MPFAHGFRLRTGGFARRVGAAAAISTLALLPVACSNSPSASDTAGTAAEQITLTDQWIKAVPTVNPAEHPMSGAFGVFHNKSDKPVNLVAATSPASETVEIHETAPNGAGEKMMRPKAGGLVIPAHGDATLAPGGDHLMFMGLKAPLRTGSETPITLTFSDGSTTTVTAQVRDFAGGKESYQPSGDGAGSGDKAAHGG